ncbi:MAG: hypothetical protein NTZ54_02400, partial [Alphaproteobacteria bacterium]|nr:hypothetical protein [Alphaproteobacteria bacterium]
MEWKDQNMEVPLITVLLQPRSACLDRVTWFRVLGAFLVELGLGLLAALLRGAEKMPGACPGTSVSDGACRLLRGREGGLGLVAADGLGLGRFFAGDGARL